MNCTHPGVVDTTQSDQAVDVYGGLVKVLRAVTRPLMKDPRVEGCASALFAATATEVMRRGVCGRYITPPDVVCEPSAVAGDEGLQERLWELSEGLLREKVGGEAGGGDFVRRMGVKEW